MWQVSDREDQINDITNIGTKENSAFGTVDSAVTEKPAEYPEKDTTDGKHEKVDIIDVAEGERPDCGTAPQHQENIINIAADHVS